MIIIPVSGCPIFDSAEEFGDLPIWSNEEAAQAIADRLLTEARHYVRAVDVEGADHVQGGSAVDLRVHMVAAGITVETTLFFRRMHRYGLNGWSSTSGEPAWTKSSPWFYTPSRPFLLHTAVIERPSRSSRREIGRANRLPKRFCKAYEKLIGLAWRSEESLAAALR